jgi:hypothetical protein
LIDDYDTFEILPTFIKSDLKNIFLLYSVSDLKPAEYGKIKFKKKKKNFFFYLNNQNIFKIVYLYFHEKFIYLKKNLKFLKNKSENYFFTF